MRRVELLKVEWPVVGGQRTKSQAVVGEGWFHQWGAELHENQDGRMVPYSIAIIERDGGQVESWYPDRIKFKDQP